MGKWVCRLLVGFDEGMDWGDCSFVMCDERLDGRVRSLVICDQRLVNPVRSLVSRNEGKDGNLFERCLHKSARTAGHLSGQIGLPGLA